MGDANPPQPGNLGEENPEVPAIGPAQGPRGDTAKRTSLIINHFS